MERLFSLSLSLSIPRHTGRLSGGMGRGTPLLSQRVYGTTENRMGVLEKKVCFHRDISPCKMEYYAKGGRDMAEQPLSPEEGFASILERYEKMVYGFALARTGSRADADDVFQEVFLAYFQCGKHFQEEEHRRAWLLRTTLNFSRPGDLLPLAEACGPPLGACGCAGRRTNSSSVLRRRCRSRAGCVCCGRRRRPNCRAARCCRP